MVTTLPATTEDAPAPPLPSFPGESRLFGRIGSFYEASPDTVKGAIIGGFFGVIVATMTVGGTFLITQFSNANELTTTKDKLKTCEDDARGAKADLTKKTELVTNMEEQLHKKTKELEKLTNNDNYKLYTDLVGEKNPAAAMGIGKMLAASPNGGIHYLILAAKFGHPATFNVAKKVLESLDKRDAWKTESKFREEACSEIAKYFAGDRKTEKTRFQIDKLMIEIAGKYECQDAAVPILDILQFKDSELKYRYRGDAVIGDGNVTEIRNACRIACKKINHIIGLHGDPCDLATSVKNGSREGT